MKYIGIKFLAIILILSAFTTDSMAATRISFARGRSATTLRGSFDAGSTREYVIGVRRSQTMTIEISSDNNSIVIDVDDVNGHLEYGDNYSQIRTNANGDHYITLKNDGNGSTRYAMTVTVR